MPDLEACLMLFLENEKQLIMSAAAKILKKSHPNIGQILMTIYA